MALAKYAHDVSLCIIAAFEQQTEFEKKQQLMERPSVLQQQGEDERKGIELSNRMPRKGSGFDLFQNMRGGESSSGSNSKRVSVKTDMAKANNPKTKKTRRRSSASIAYAPKFLLSSSSHNANYDERVSSTITSNGEAGAGIEAVERKSSLILHNNIHGSNEEDSDVELSDGDDESDPSLADNSKKHHWKTLQGSIRRKVGIINALSSGLHRKDSHVSEYSHSWGEMSGNNPRYGAVTDTLSDPDAQATTLREAIEQKQREGIEVDWGEINENAFNHFEDMILVSQAASVQLDFMRRICPEFTARQTLAELVIFLAESFEETYVVLSIPIMNGGYNQVLRIANKPQGGVSTTRVALSGLTNFLIETGRTINTDDIMAFVEEENSHSRSMQLSERNRGDGDDVALAISNSAKSSNRNYNNNAGSYGTYNPKQDEVPHHFHGIDGPRYSEYTAFLGFHESPFEVNSEEAMVMAVSLRSTKVFSAADEACVRGLVKTALDGISYEQFGAACQLKGIVCSADVNDSVRAKILYLENVQTLLQDATESLKSSTSCCCRSTGMCHLANTALHGVYVHFRLVTGKNTLLHPTEDGGSTESLALEFGEKREGKNAQEISEGGDITTNISSCRLRIFEWVECNMDIAAIPQDALAIFELCDDKNHVLGWSFVPLFDYAKRFVKDVHRLRMYPGEMPLDTTSLAAALENTTLDTSNGGTSTDAYLSILFESAYDDIVCSESWTALAKSSRGRRLSMVNVATPRMVRANGQTPVHRPSRQSNDFRTPRMSASRKQGEMLSQNEERILNKVLKKHEAGVLVDESEARALWQVRRKLQKQYSYSLPVFVNAVTRHLKDKLIELYTLLQGWDAQSVADALELLGCDDSFVRAYAVQEFDFLANDHVLCMYMLQLTQALKGEPYHDSALARFLLRRAIANPARVGHCLYWSLQADLHIPGSAHRFGLIVNIFLRHCGAYRRALGHQCFILQKLQQVQTAIKVSNFPFCSVQGLSQFCNALFISKNVKFLYLYLIHTGLLYPSQFFKNLLPCSEFTAFSFIGRKETRTS